MARTAYDSITLSSRSPGMIQSIPKTLKGESPNSLPDLRWEGNKFVSFLGLTTLRLKEFTTYKASLSFLKKDDMRPCGRSTKLKKKERVEADSRDA